MGCSLRTLKPLDIHAYGILDDLSGTVICLMAIFSPWAFGTTQHWSIWTMNACGYVLGGMLSVKLLIRYVKGYAPRRWEGDESPWARRVLAVLSIALLSFCFVSAANARATFLPSEFRFEYHENISWLPASLDSNRTWTWFYRYLALACAFWATRDWLLGITMADSRASVQHHTGVPRRLRLLLWVLVLNGALLALEGIVQRIEGSGRLLFLVKPRVNPGADTQFGPWAYRGNAASYFNLLWPLALGLWWALWHRNRSKGGKHHMLLIAAGLMASCPLISTSRGGAFVTLGLVAVTFGLMVLFGLLSRSTRHDPRNALGTLIILLVFAGVALGLGYHYGWKALKPRVSRIALLKGLDSREEANDNARPMARDYPVFGTGPGTFEPVFLLYRKSEQTYWPAQLHNDWLETRITFGIVGSGLVALALATVFLRWFFPGGIHGSRRFMAMAWLATAGCMAHARYDFPFQIYSILFLYVLICAILFTQTRAFTSR